MKGFIMPKTQELDPATPDISGKKIRKVHLKWIVIAIAAFIGGLAAALIYFLKTDLKDKTGKTDMKKVGIGVAYTVGFALLGVAAGFVIDAVGNID